MRLHEPCTRRRTTQRTNLAFLLLMMAFACFMIRIFAFSRIESGSISELRTTMRVKVLNKQELEIQEKEREREKMIQKRMTDFVERGGKVHFIHIGKTGGTYFVDNMPPGIDNHWHDTQLGDLKFEVS